MTCKNLYVVTFKNNQTTVFHVKECAMIFCKAFGATMVEVPDLGLSLT